MTPQTPQGAALSDADILPCPFCGAGTTQLRENGRIWSGMKYSEPSSVSVEHWCEKVDGQPSRMIERVGRDRASAIEAWNRRAADRRLTAEQPAWRFERLDASKRIIATEPNGTEHILAKAELGSVAATTLFDRMAVALSARPSVTAEQPVAYTDPLYFRIKQRGGCFTATYEPDELFNFPLYTRAPVTAEQGGADAALKRIVTTYDAYRRRGVSPAPVEYSDVVQAIESGRASLTTQPQAEPAGWREALQWIASVNAMDHEYQAVARLALDQGRVTTPTEPT